MPKTKNRKRTPQRPPAGAGKVLCTFTQEEMDAINSPNLTPRQEALLMGIGNRLPFLFAPTEKAMLASFCQYAGSIR